MSKDTGHRPINDNERLPAAETGNASNPSPEHGEVPLGPSQLIDPKGEKYLREVANIEDVPDAQEQEEMDQALQQDREPNDRSGKHPDQ